MVKKHYYGHRQRLRQRFWQQGLTGFQDYEALELLLLYVARQRDMKPVAKALVERFGSFKNVVDASAEELQAVEGVGPAAVALIHFVKPDQGTAYTITLADTDIGDAPSARVTDTLPISLAYQTGLLWADAGSYGEAGGVITWMGSIAAGSSIALRYTAVVSPSLVRFGHNGPRQQSPDRRRCEPYPRVGSGGLHQPVSGTVATRSKVSGLPK